MVVVVVAPRAPLGCGGPYCVRTRKSLLDCLSMATARVRASWKLLWWTNEGRLLIDSLVLRALMLRPWSHPPSCSNTKQACCLRIIAPCVSGKRHLAVRRARVIPDSRPVPASVAVVLHLHYCNPLQSTTCRCERRLTVTVLRTHILFASVRSEAGSRTEATYAIVMRDEPCTACATLHHDPSAHPFASRVAIGPRLTCPTPAPRRASPQPPLESA